MVRPAAVIASFFMLGMQAFGQNATSPFLIPTSDVKLSSGGDGRIIATIPRAALFSALADKLNTTWVGQYEECGPRLTGIWFPGSPDSGTLTFSASVELWTCVVTKIPKFSGLDVRTETLKIPTKLIQTRAELSVQASLSIKNGALYITLKTVKVEFPNIKMASLLGNINGSMDKEVIYQMITFTKGVSDSEASNKLGDRTFDIGTLPEATIGQDGSFQLTLNK